MPTVAPGTWQWKGTYIQGLEAIEVPEQISDSMHRVGLYVQVGWDIRRRSNRRVDSGEFGASVHCALVIVRPS